MAHVRYPWGTGHGLVKIVGQSTACPVCRRRVAEMLLLQK
jgi:hypothetical protein